MSAHRFLTSSIKISLVRFTRKSLTIYTPLVSLEDRRANVSRSRRHFAFSVYAHSHTFSLLNSFDSLTHVLTATSINRNFLVEKSNYISALWIHRHVAVLFRKNRYRRVCRWYVSPGNMSWCTCYTCIKLDNLRYKICSSVCIGYKYQSSYLRNWYYWYKC